MRDFGHIPAGIAAAVVIASAFAALAAFLARKGEAQAGPRWGLTMGLGLGYVAGHAAVREWLNAPRLREAWAALEAWSAEGGGFPAFPGDVTDWLPWLASAATVFGVLDGWKPSPWWAKWENRLLLTGLTLWLLLAPLFGGTWEPGQGVRWLLGLGLGMLAMWSVLDARAEPLGGSMPLVLLVMAIALAVSLGLSGSFVFGALGGVLAATLGGAWLVSWAAPRMTLSRGAIPLFVVLYSGLVLCGLFYAELPKISGLALALAPLASFADRIGPVSRLSKGRVASIRTAALLVPLAVAVGMAIAMRPAEVASEGY